MGNALKELGKGLNRAWENVTEGWRDLEQRSSSALTRFIPAATAGGRADANFPQWGMLAGEVIETDKSIVIKVELPGIMREDCDIRATGCSSCGGSGSWRSGNACADAKIERERRPRHQRV